MISHLSACDFNTKVLKSDRLTVVDFWAPWCKPCKTLAPILEEISSEYNGKLQICKVNLEKSYALATKYQILSIPTLLFFKQGRPVRDLVGLKSKFKIKKTINSLI